MPPNVTVVPFLYPTANWNIIMYGKKELWYCVRSTVYHNVLQVLQVLYNIQICTLNSFSGEFIRCIYNKQIEIIVSESTINILYLNKLFNTVY